MSKFLRVEKAPETLKSNEYVITEPNFVDEIKQARNAPRPVGGRMITTLNHLRTIAGNVGELYDESFNEFSSIPLSHYVGIEYKDNLDLSNKVICPMFEKHYPQMFFKYIDQQIKKRPAGVELIYFVGSPKNAEAFLANGINQVDEKDAKKIVQN